MHIYFINHHSALHGRLWNCTQANFTAGARGSLKQTQFLDRLRLLAVTNSKARNKIRALTVSKTLALLDIILKLFHVSILRSPEWALSSGSVPTELANSQTSAFKLFKKITGPYMYIYVYTYVYIYMCIYKCMYVYMCVYMYVCMYVCLCGYMYICMCIFMCV